MIIFLSFIFCIPENSLRGGQIYSPWQGSAVFVISCLLQGWSSNFSCGGIVSWQVCSLGHYNSSSALWTSVSTLGALHALSRSYFVGTYSIYTCRIVLDIEIEDTTFQSTAENIPLPKKSGFAARVIIGPVDITNPCCAALGAARHHNTDRSIVPTGLPTYSINPSITLCLAGSLLTVFPAR